MAQKSAKNIIGHLHRGKAREKRDNNNNNNKFRKNFRYVNIFSFYEGMANLRL